MLMGDLPRLAGFLNLTISPTLVAGDIVWVNTLAFVALPTDFFVATLPFAMAFRAGLVTFALVAFFLLLAVLPALAFLLVLTFFELLFFL